MLVALLPALLKPPRGLLVVLARLLELELVAVLDPPVVGVLSKELDSVLDMLLLPVSVPLDVPVEVCKLRLGCGILGDWIGLPMIGKVSVCGPSLRDVQVLEHKLTMVLALRLAWGESDRLRGRRERQ